MGDENPVDHPELKNIGENEMPIPHVKLERVQIYKCNLCSRGFLNEFEQKKHIQEYYQKKMDSTEDNNNQQDKPYKCEHCNLRFVAESTLKAHSVVHKPFPFICECGVGYYKKADCEAHKRLMKCNIKKTPVKMEYLSSDSDYTDVKAPKTKAKRDKTKKETKSKVKMEYLSDDSDYTDEKAKTKAKGGKTKKQTRSKNVNKCKKASLKKEEIEKDDDGQYVCPRCPKRFPKYASLSLHFRAHDLGNDDSRPKLDKNTKVQCEFCEKTLARTSLATHMRIHTGEKPYSCNFCPMRFTQPGALKLHMTVHTGARNFPCEFCPKRFRGIGALALHRRIHTGEKPFECKTCGKKFSDPSAYNRHIRIHTGLKPYRCRYCPKAFCDNSAFVVHERRHLNLEFPCEICKKKLSTKYQLKRHIRRYHENHSKKFECDYCGKMFSYKNYIVSHISRVHNISRYSCKKCNIGFTGGNAYNRHMEEDHPKFVYKCEFCKKVLPCDKTLSEHLEEDHASEPKIYKCEYCQKRFKLKVLFNVHMDSEHNVQCRRCKESFPTIALLKQHSSNACFRCPECKRVFDTRRKFDAHLSTHIPGSKVLYSCDQCPEHYTAKIELLNHLITHNDLKYTCHHCQSKFVKKKVLKDHIWEKHMLSLYCNICYKRFYNESNFQKHKLIGCAVNVSCDICKMEFSNNITLSWHLKSHVSSDLKKENEVNKKNEEEKENKTTINSNEVKKYELTQAQFDKH